MCFSCYSQTQMLELEERSQPLTVVVLFIVIPIYYATIYTESLNRLSQL